MRGCPDSTRRSTRTTASSDQQEEDADADQRIPPLTAVGSITVSVDQSDSLPVVFFDQQHTREVPIPSAFAENYFRRNSLESETTARSVKFFLNNYPNGPWYYGSLCGGVGGGADLRVVLVLVGTADQVPVLPVGADAAHVPAPAHAR
jgi:hypothetical protein